MIRINLLPTRDAPRRQAAVIQLVVMGIILVVVVVVLVMVDSLQRGEIAAQQRANHVIENRIQRIERQIQDHDEIRQRIEEIESKQRVIDRLQNGRTGPVMVMIELSKLLSRNGAPTIDHDRYIELVRRSPNQAYDPNWDGRRLWLQAFREENREVELIGTALSHEDVAEFLRRLYLSDYFTHVVLVETRSADEQNNQNATFFGPSLVNFEIHCRLRYGGRPRPRDDQQAEGEGGASQAAGTGA